MSEFTKFLTDVQHVIITDLEWIKNRPIPKGEGFPFRKYGGYSVEFSLRISRKTWVGTLIWHSAELTHSELQCLLGVASDELALSVIELLHLPSDFGNLTSKVRQTWLCSQSPDVSIISIQCRVFRLEFTQCSSLEICREILTALYSTIKVLDCIPDLLRVLKFRSNPARGGT